MERKTIFVTGGADGIGKSIAKLFASKGWTVGILDINEPKLSKTKNELGENTSAYIGSVTDSDEVAAALKSFVSANGGKLDVLVNNAGILHTGNYDELSFEDSEAVIQVNLIGLMRVTKLAIPYLKKAGKSRIINMASISAVAGIPRLAAYAASKAAVKSLTETWSLTLAKHGISVSAVLPHIVNTQMTADNQEGLGVQSKSDIKLTTEQVGEVTWQAAHGSKIHYPVGSDAKTLFYLSGVLPTKTFLGQIKKILKYE